MTNKTWKVSRADGTTLAVVKVVNDGADTLVKWDGDAEFANDPDGMELLISGSWSLTEI